MFLASRTLTFSFFLFSLSLFMCLYLCGFLPLCSFLSSRSPWEAVECAIQKRIPEKEGGRLGSEFQPPFCHFIIEDHQASCLTFLNLDFSEHTMDSHLRLGRQGWCHKKESNSTLGSKDLGLLWALSGTNSVAPSGFLDLPVSHGSNW